MKNKILRTIQNVFCAVMMVVVVIISTVFILIAPIAQRVIRQNIFVAILTGGDIYRNHDNDFQDTFKHISIMIRSLRNLILILIIRR